MGRWMNIRLVLHKYNSYLLYGMCAMIFTTQLAMVYVHRTGGQARVKPEDLFKKGEYIEKIEEMFAKFSKFRRIDPFEPSEDEIKKKNKSGHVKEESSTG